MTRQEALSMDRYDVIVDYLTNVGVDETDEINAWNEYCDFSRYDEDKIYFMDELDDMVGKLYPSDFFSKFEDFDFSDYYFSTNGYDFESFSDIFDKVDEGDLAQYMADNEEYFGLYDLQEAVEEWEALCDEEDE